MAKFRNIKIKGISGKMSKTGKSATILITNWSAVDKLKEALAKRPIGREEFPEEARIFGISNSGIYEIYDDNDDMPPDYNDTKDTSTFGEGDEEDLPF